MKKLIVLIVIAAISSSTFCQINSRNDPQNSLSSATYRPKAQKQKTFAWICLGNNSTVDFLMTAGVVTALGSIPLFSGASHNRHKAKMMMTEQKKVIGLPIAAPKKIPSLTLSISI